MLHRWHAVIRRWLWRLRWRAGWVVAAVVVVILSAVPLPLGPVVVIMRGSNTIGSELAPDLVLGYLRSRSAGDLAIASSARTPIMEAPGTDRSIRFEIGSEGSDTAFECGIDIGMSSREITPDERDRLEPCRGNLQDSGQEVALAVDAVAVIAHPGIGVRDLSVQELQRIFSCDIRDWSEIGLPPGVIQLFRRNDESGTADVFRDRVLNSRQICSESQEFEDSQQLSERVAQTAGAIGFVGLPFVGSNTLVAVSSGDDSVPTLPDESSVRSGDYVLSRGLYLYVSDRPSEVVREFLTYARDCDGQQQVDDAGFFRGVFLPCESGPDPVDASIIPTPCPGGAPLDYCEFVEGAARFPFSVRFDTAAGTVDGRSEQDLAQLAEYMRQPGQNGRQILLAGFTDGVGDPGPNLVLSQQRAESVAGLIGQLGIPNVEPRGFGEQFLIDDDSEDGQQRNRRVEVWIR